MSGQLRPTVAPQLSARQGERRPSPRLECDRRPRRRVDRVGVGGAPVHGGGVEEQARRGGERARDARTHLDVSPRQEPATRRQGADLRRGDVARGTGPAGRRRVVAGPRDGPPGTADSGDEQHHHGGGEEQAGPAMGSRCGREQVDRRSDGRAGDDGQLRRPPSSAPPPDVVRSRRSTGPPARSRGWRRHAAASGPWRSGSSRCRRNSR